MGNLFIKTTHDDVGPENAGVLARVVEDRFTMASDNGATDGEFGKVERLTLMQYVDTASDLRVRPYAKTLANGAGAGSSTLIVDDASNFYVGDAIFIAGTDSTETVQSIDKSTETITLTGNATWSDNDEISISASNELLGVLLHDTTTYEGAVDSDGAVVHRDRRCMLLTIGVVNRTRVVGDVSVAETEASVGHGIIFDQDRSASPA